MEVRKLKLSQVKQLESNPRIIKDSKFEQLVQSIKDFPEMLKVRPIILNIDFQILGGKMRFEACKKAGLKEAWFMIADNFTEKQQKEFLIKDNLHSGQWDWEKLGNEWELEDLEDWGLDVLKDLLPAKEVTFKAADGKSLKLKFTESEHAFVVNKLSLVPDDMSASLLKLLGYED